MCVCGKRTMTYFSVGSSIVGCIKLVWFFSVFLLMLIRLENENQYYEKRYSAVIA